MSTETPTTLAERIAEAIAEDQPCTCGEAGHCPCCQFDADSAAKIIEGGIAGVVVALNNANSKSYRGVDRNGSIFIIPYDDWMAVRSALSATERTKETPTDVALRDIVDFASSAAEGDKP